MSRVKFIKATQGWGAGYLGTGRGPNVLDEWGLFNRLKDAGFDFDLLAEVAPDTANPVEDLPMDSVYHHVHDYAVKLAGVVEQVIKEDGFPIVLGGEHSLAMGTWSGVTNGLDAHEQFGLLWFDAHMDAHRPITSLTSGAKWGGHLHGTPLAHLLGHGDRHLCEIGSQKTKIAFEYTALIGIRSYEEQEREFLDRFGVRVFYMDEVKERGFETCWQEALAIVSSAPKGYGISFDCDGFDPFDAPGVGTPEESGVFLNDLAAILKNNKLINNIKAFEIVEYNALNDDGYKTAETIEALLKLMLPHIV